MLRRYHIVRFATKHSPEKEGRLLGFANGPQTPQGDEPVNDEDELIILQFPAKSKESDAALQSGEITLSKRQQFHTAIMKTALPDEQQDVLRIYRPEIESDMGSIENPSNDKELDEIIRLTQFSIVDELNRETRERAALANAIKNIDTSDASDEEIRTVLQAHANIISRYITLSPSFRPKSAMNLIQCLLHQDILWIRARDHERETGIKWTFLKKEEFEELYREIRNKKPEDEIRIPNAFSHGNTMYFDAESKDFSDPENGEVLTKRAVTHEATHLAIKAADKEKNIESWTNTLRAHPDWEKLVQAVEVIFINDADYLGEQSEKNNLIVHEALAIHATHERHPSSKALASQASYIAQAHVFEVVQGILDHPHSTLLTSLKKDLDTRLDYFLEIKKRNGESKDIPVSDLLSNASKEVLTQQRLAELAKTTKIAHADGTYSIVTNPDEGNDLAKEDLKEASSNKKEEKNPTMLLDINKRVGKSLSELGEEFPAMKKKIESEKVDRKIKEEALAALDHNLEWISLQQNDVQLIDRTVTQLQNAEEQMAQGTLSLEDKKALHKECIPEAPNPYENLTDENSAEEIAAADTIFEKNRQIALEVVYDVLTQIERIAKRIKEGITVEEPIDSPAVAESGGFMNWFRKNVSGPNSGIMWVTPLNIMNIIKIYREAIVENYKSNQVVKENRLARKLNFYKPIQHTLNKQSRSSNEKETSEFKEYIEREGFTFEEIFGKDGKGLRNGLLHQNRHNFNRAKAVLLYASDHAWLYHMDRLNGGHDVYGVDYEGIEGKQSFEELVQQHESGKSKQIQQGIDRVDKDPDVPPIIDTIMHELDQKNVFVVQGIMKRLQEKAKYSHANTWMLSTLIMMIRDNPNLKVCFDKGMIDNISNFTISQSAWSVTWLKVLRNDLMKWKEGKVEFGKGDILTKTIKRIEEKFAEQGVEFPTDKKGYSKEKYEAIGFVLAGKTFGKDNEEARSRLGKYLPTQPISLFEDDFTDYREAFIETANTSTDPTGTDDDYWNPKNGGGDVMLLGRIPTVEIIDRKSTGTFEHRVQARGFFAQIFDRYDHLTEAAKNTSDEKTKVRMVQARENFISEMRSKLLNEKDRTGWVYGAVLGNPASLKQFPTELDANGKTILLEMERVGLISGSLKKEIEEKSKK